MADLPEGFVLDAQKGPPEGFVLDKHRPGWGELASDVGGYLKNIGKEAVRTPVESYESAKQDLAQGAAPRNQPGEGFWEGLGKDILDKPAQMGRMTRGLATAAGLPLSPAYGAAKSAVGQPMASVIHTAGQYINPEEAAKHTPQDIYEDIRPDVETALGTTGLGGASSKVRPAMPTNVKQLPEPALPTLAERKAAAKSAYNHPDIKAAELKPAAVNSLVNTIETDLTTAGFRPTTNGARSTFLELRRMSPRLRTNAPIMIDDLDAARRAFGKYAMQVDAAGAPTTEATAAARAISHIDDFLLNLQQSQLYTGNAKRIGKILNEARADWASYKRGQLVDTLEQNADMSRASTYGGGNANNAIRQKFRPLTFNNFGRLKGWSPEAKDVFARVVSGGPQTSYANVTRQIGRFSPSGPVGLLSHMANLYGLGPAVALPLAAGAYAAKKMGIAATRSNVQKVREQLAKESTLYKSRLAAQQAAQRAVRPTRANRGFIPLVGRTQGHLFEDIPERGVPSQNPYAP